MLSQSGEGGEGLTIPDGAEGGEDEPGVLLRRRSQLLGSAEGEAEDVSGSTPPRRPPHLHHHRRQSSTSSVQAAAEEVGGCGRA